MNCKKILPSDNLHIRLVFCVCWTGAIKCVCFSSDGKLFASASYDHTVKIMSSTTGKELYSLEGAENLSNFIFVEGNIYQ